MEIRADIEAAAGGAVGAEQIDRPIELLRSRLLDHVLKEDLLLKPELAGYAENLAGRANAAACGQPGAAPSSLRSLASSVALSKGLTTKSAAPAVRLSTTRSFAL